MQNDVLKIQENLYWARKIMIILLQGIFFEIRKVCLIDQ